MSFPTNTWSGQASSAKAAGGVVHGDFIKFNEWHVRNGEPPVDVPDDVDEETITAWDDLSAVQRWMLEGRDWRGLEPSRRVPPTLAG